MIYLSPKDVAALLGIGERAVRKNAAQGVYGEIRYEEGTLGRGGRSIRIPLSGLPAKAQSDYWAAAASNHEAPLSLPDLTADEQRKLGEKLEILAAWQAFRAAHQGSATARQIDQNFVKMWKASHPGTKLSVATLHRWEKTRREQGETGLVDRRGKQRAGESSIPDDMWEMFKGLYLDQNKLSISQAYNTIRDMALVQGRLDEVPHESAFRRRVEREIPRDMLIYMREGPRAWYLKAAPYIERDHTSVAPGGVFEMDHFQLDFAVRGENGRAIRPWLSAVMDFRTRRYVGWALTDRPCQDSTMAAFGMAAMDREIGVPDALLLDNGREYTGYSFAGRGHRKVTHRLDFDEPYVRSLVETLGVSVHFSIPGNPTSKGDIERSFREIHESFCKMFDSYLGNRPENRPEDAEQAVSDPEKLPTIPELFPILSDFIRYVFNERPHTAKDMKGMSPRQAWEAAEHMRPVRHVDRDVLKMLMMPYAAGRLFTVQKGGIRVWGERYWSHALQEHLGEKVLVRYDQADASRVYVFRPDGTFIDNPEIQTRLPFGATADDLKKAQRQRAKRNKELAAMRREMREMAAGEILSTRIEAGKRRLAAERAETGERPTRVTQINPLDRELRTAAQEVAAAREEAAAAKEQPRDSERIDFMAVINGMPLPNESSRHEPSETARRFLHVVPRNRR